MQLLPSQRHMASFLSIAHPNDKGFVKAKAVVVFSILSTSSINMSPRKSVSISDAAFSVKKILYLHSATSSPKPLIR